jgi:nucleotide-binding universal stress UspA family protein
MDRMTTTILIPVDLQDEQPAWLPEAARIARSFGARVVLQHVVDYVPTLFPVEMPPDYQMPQIEFVQAAALRRLEKLTATFEGLDVTPVVDVGGAAHEIIARAERDGADHIVLASHNRGVLARMVLGSVAERVVRQAPCPVTIVRLRKSGEAVVQGDG